MRSFQIVIAEDDPLLARVLSVHCRGMGGQVRIAPDAMMALTYMHKRPPDIVLLDLHLPAGNGTGIMEMMRADERLANVPVVVYSGTSDADAIDRVADMGGHFVHKTTEDWDTLKRLIQSLILEQRRGNAPRREAIVR